VRKKCGRGERSPEVVELVGPCLRDAREAAEAVRLSYGSGGKESIVILVCDPDRRVVLAVDFEGAPASAATAVLDCMIEAVPEESALVVGLVRPGGSAYLDRFESEAVREMADVCRLTGIGLLYVIVANDEGWRRVPELSGDA
jgi:hypothetical protein